MRQYATALDGVKAQARTIGAERTKPGSFDALCVSFYRSPDFLGLRSSTQSARRHILERFRQAHGSKPLRGLHRQHITTVIGAKADTPEAADHLLKTLRIILSYAVAQGMLDSNPAAGIKKYRSQGEGHHSWSESEIAQFEQRHSVGSKARLARLANAGCSVDQVKAITGHRSLAEVARYTKAADQRRLARQALDIPTSDGRRTKIVQP
jgi:hypothetical protein